MPQFNIMAKPTCGVCNLDCSYCYYTKKVLLYPDNRRFMMSDDVLKEYIRQYQENQPGQVVYSWQGGEPLLAGIDFYRRALELQEEARQPGQMISNTVQTNGTLINDEWCQLFKENQFLLGLSLDGPQEVHDHFRRDGKDQGSYEKAWHGADLLRKHQVDYNVLVTLNNLNAPLGGDLYRFFVEKGITWLQFIPILEKCDNGTPQPYSCDPAAYGRFLCQVFDTWHLNDVGKISVRFFESIVFSLVQGTASVCCLASRCANAHVLEFNGDLYACDHFVEPEWCLGNIMETPLKELLESPKLAEFAQLKTDLTPECQACEYVNLCFGGCPKHYLPAGENATRKNLFCAAYKEIFAHSLDKFVALAKEITSPPPEAEPAPTTDMRPGRNDPCPCGSGKKFKKCCGRS